MNSCESVNHGFVGRPADQTESVFQRRRLCIRLDFRNWTCSSKIVLNQEVFDVAAATKLHQWARVSTAIDLFSSAQPSLGDRISRSQEDSGLQCELSFASADTKQSPYVTKCRENLRVERKIVPVVIEQSTIASGHWASAGVVPSYEPRLVQLAEIYDVNDMKASSICISGAPNRYRTDLESLLFVRITLQEFQVM